jgi:hypothetical protein
MLRLLESLRLSLRMIFHIPYKSQYSACVNQSTSAAGVRVVVVFDTYRFAHRHNVIQGVRYSMMQPTPFGCVFLFDNCMLAFQALGMRNQILDNLLHTHTHTHTHSVCNGERGK